MDELKNLNLTEKDFELLVDGLDALPEKGAAGSMMIDLIGAAMMKDGEGKEQFLKRREADAAKKEKEKKEMIEEIRILQGKLLMMKQYLKQNKLLKEYNDILNP